ncbi:MAG: VanZ family protein [Dehalococcoidia bacterium]
MRTGRLRRLSMFAALVVAVVIIVLTLLVSPAQDDALARFLPTIVTRTGGEAGHDACIGGIPCQDGHAIAFLVLAFLAAVHVSASWPPGRRVLPLLRLTALLIAFAAADEVAQRWAGRSPSLNDWLADLGGILVGVVLASQVTPALLRAKLRRERPRVETR